MPTTTKPGAILFLHVQTSMHCGSGHALGTIDLPIQRERHTSFPNAPGSTLKGILRDACRENLVGNGLDPEKVELFSEEAKTAREDASKDTQKKWSKRKAADHTIDLAAVFGPPSGQASDFGGALQITDARLLAFPVRSLKGVFAWVTCPAVLLRAKNDALLAGQPIKWSVPTVAENQCLTAVGSSLLLGNGNEVILEEYRFTRPNGDAGNLPANLGDWFANTVLCSKKERDGEGNEIDVFAGNHTRIKTHLVVLNDDDFSHFVRHATEVNARIGLNYETKTVKGGALFYQEFLPAETLMYALAFADPPRAGDATKTNGRKVTDAAAVLNWVAERTPMVLQIGGDESIGRGICLTNWKQSPNTQQ